MSGSVSPAFSQTVAALADPTQGVPNLLDMASRGQAMQARSLEMQNSALEMRRRQIDNAGALVAAGTRAGASVIYDPSDANINNQFDRLIALGYPKEINTERAALLAEPDLKVRSQRAFEHVNSLQDAGDMLKTGVGATTQVNFGGTQGPVTTIQPRPDLPGGSVTLGPTQFTNTVPPGGWREWTDRAGNAHSGTEADAAEARGRGEMVGPSRVVATPSPGAIISPPRSATAPPAAQPGAAPPPAPPAKGTRLGSGAYGGRAAPGSAAAPAASPAAPAAPAPAAEDKTLGPSKQLQPDVDAYNEAIKTVFPQHQKILAGESALEALKQVEATGPGTSGVNAAKAFMIAHGIPGSEGLDQPGTEAYQYARKQMLRFAAGNGAKVSTDFAKNIDLESNANVDALLKGVNRHILVQDIGIERQKQAQTLTMPPGGTGKSDFGNGAAEHIKNFPSGTDWHAFSWDIMDSEERRAYMHSIQPDPKAPPTPALLKFKKSQQIAYANGLWSNQPPPPAAPAPQDRPASTPAPPVVNALTPPGA